MPNPYVNKVTVNDQTVIDLTADTVDAAHLLSGYTAHDRTGAAIVGTATGGGGGSVTQDQDGYLVLPSTGGGGGGATNCVCGTFTTSSTKGEASTFTIPYTGSGYPIFLAVYIDGGVNNSPLFNLGNTTGDTDNYSGLRGKQGCL